MKHLIALFLIIFISIGLWSQNSESAFSASLQDSLSVSDSLKILTEEIGIALSDSTIVDSTIIDTTNIEQVYQPGDPLYVPTREDSLAAEAAANFEEKNDALVVNLEEVDLRISEIISGYNKSRKQDLPFMYYRENYHTFWPLSANITIKKYGFTKRSYLTSALQSWQNFSPDNSIRYDNGLLNINSYNYSELPLLTISNLVLGEDDMNHAMISMMKGYILGIKDLNFSGSYLGQEGLWLGEQEKSANFGGHLFYKKDWATIHYFYNQIEQDLSLKKINFSDNFMISANDFSKEEITEHTFRIDNKFLNLGFSYSKYNFYGSKLEDYQYLLNKSLDFGHTSLNINAEYLNQKAVKDTSFTILSLEHKSDFGILETNNTVHYVNDEENRINSESFLNFSKPVSLIIKYSDFAQRGLEPYTKMGGGVALNLGESNLKLTGGLFKKNGFETNYVEADGLVNIPFGNYNLSYAVWALAITAEQDFYPTIQTRNRLELGYDLKRNNYIRFGLNQIFSQEFLQYNSLGTRLNKAFILDAYFALQITKYFEFQIDIKNLTSETQLFSFGGNTENEIPGLHFNAGVSWVFLN